MVRKSLNHSAILSSECSVFSWPPTFFLIAAEGWGEKEICTKGAVDGQK